MRWVLTFLGVVITVVISILSIVAASKNLQLLLKETETCTESALRDLVLTKLTHCLVYQKTHIQCLTATQLKPNICRFI